MASEAVAGGEGKVKSASQIVLLTLAAGQFLMTLDSSVMNVSIAQVAEDVGTTVTGIQTRDHAVHAGDGDADDHRRQDRRDDRPQARVRDRLRDLRRRLVHDRDLAPNLTVLLIGWSFLEGVGAALIMPAIVALVAANFARPSAGRPRTGWWRPRAPSRSPSAR